MIWAIFAIQKLLREDLKAHVKKPLMELEGVDGIGGVMKKIGLQIVNSRQVIIQNAHQCKDFVY